MKFLLALTAILIASSAAYDHSLTVNNVLDNFMDGSVKDLFKVWHLLYQRQYTLDSEEARQRFRNFKANVAEIKAFNSQNHSYKQGLNEFSDMTFEEFSKIYLTEKVPETPSPNFLPIEDDDDDLTKRRVADLEPINWQKLYSSVRNQGGCGSCWAFSAAGAVDGSLSLKLGSPQPFIAPQQLVDCDKSNGGCGGGYYPNAFKYWIKQGAVYEKDYTYKGANNNCTLPVGSPRVNVTGVEYCNDDFNVNSQKCTSGTVHSILKKGPASVSVYVDSNFCRYKSGVYTCASCKGSNHAVVAVGYGYDQETKLFHWVIRNSWGSGWGLQGHIKIQDNPSTKSCWVTNRCYRVLLD